MSISRVIHQCNKISVKRGSNKHNGDKMIIHYGDTSKLKFDVINYLANLEFHLLMLRESAELPIYDWSDRLQQP